MLWRREHCIAHCNGFSWSGPGNELTFVEQIVEVVLDVSASEADGQVISKSALFRWEGAISGSMSPSVFPLARIAIMSHFSRMLTFF